MVREERRGYGYACAAGVMAVGEDCDVLVFMDGDGSDDGAQMQALVGPIERGEADLVLGSRLLGPAARGALLAHQRLGNVLTTALVRLLYGHHPPIGLWNCLLFHDGYACPARAERRFFAGGDLCQRTARGLFPGKSLGGRGQHQVLALCRPGVGLFLSCFVSDRVVS